MSFSLHCVGALMFKTFCSSLGPPLRKKDRVFLVRVVGLGPYRALCDWACCWFVPCFKFPPFQLGLGPAAVTLVWQQSGMCGNLCREKACSLGLGFVWGAKHAVEGLDPCALG